MRCRSIVTPICPLPDATAQWGTPTNPLVNSNEQCDVVIQTFPQRFIPFEAMANHVRVTAELTPDWRCLRKALISFSKMILVSLIAGKGPQTCCERIPCHTCFPHLRIFEGRSPEKGFTFALWMLCFTAHPTDACFKCCSANPCFI